MSIVLYFYTSTSRSKRAVPNMAVCCRCIIVFVVSLQKQHTFLFSKRFRPVLESAHPPTERLSVVISPAVMGPWREDNLWPPPSTEVKNEWSYTFTSPIDLRLHFTFTYRRPRLELTVFGTINGTLWMSYHKYTNTRNIADAHLWP